MIGTNLFLTAAVAGALTLSMTGSFDVLKKATHNVVNVYEVAHQIDPWNNKRGDYIKHQVALYKTSGKLEGFAGTVMTLELDNNGRLMASNI